MSGAARQLGLMSGCKDTVEIAEVDFRIKRPYFFNGLGTVCNSPHHFVGVSDRGVGDVLVLEVDSIDKPFAFCSLGEAEILQFNDRLITSRDHE